MKKKNKKSLKIAVFYYLPLILWMGLIFYFSSLPGRGIQYPPDVWFYISRKGAHMVEYFVLTLLIIRVLRVSKIKSQDFYRAAILFPLAYAFSDEIHQLFVVGREGKFLDVGVDLVGILLAIFAFKLISKKIKKKSKYILKYIF